MRHCDHCRLSVTGTWVQCPVCGAALHGAAAPAGLPTIPQRFSRTRVLRILVVVSLALIALSWAAQVALDLAHADIGAWRYVWMGLMTLWLAVLVALRSHRGAASAVLRIAVLAALAAVAWDWLTSWHGWALDFAVPIIWASAIMALGIVLRVLRVPLTDHLHRSGVLTLLGFVPLVLVLVGWVQVAVPSIICAAVAVAAGVTQLALQRGTRSELARRLHL